MQKYYIANSMALYHKRMLYDANQLKRVVPKVHRIPCIVTVMLVWSHGKWIFTVSKHCIVKIIWLKLQRREYFQMSIFRTWRLVLNSWQLYYFRLKWVDMLYTHVFLWPDRQLGCTIAFHETTGFLTLIKVENNPFITLYIALDISLSFS